MLLRIVISILAVGLFSLAQCRSSAANRAEAVLVRDNVVFCKTNEVSTTRAKWLATLIIDFHDLV